MSAVVRVKRRINEEPLTAFVLNCKKRKLENGVESADSLFETKDEVSTVLKFAGTVEYQDEPVVAQINRITKDDAKTLVTKQRKPANQTEKMRQEMRDNLHENRFKVVNCYRTLKHSDSENGQQKEITVVDIEKDASQKFSNDANSTKTDSEEQQQKPSTSSNSPNNIANACAATHSNSSMSNYDNTLTELPDNYVYDLYLPENDEQPTNFDNMDNYNISVRPFDDLVYEDGYRDASEASESEDSNCEGYYKNDYPDSEDDYAYNMVGDDDIRDAVNRIRFDDDEDDGALSSDENDENCNNGFVYSIDSEGIGFEDDIDYCDVNRYGEAYARYKARILRKKPKNHDYDSEASDDDYDSD